MRFISNIRWIFHENFDFRFLNLSLITEETSFLHKKKMFL